MAVQVPPLAEQDEKGVYFEEVGMLVDGIVDQIASGQLTGRDTCLATLDELVAYASHINNDDLCVRVLKWSKYPTAFFWNNGKDSGIDPAHWAAQLHEEPRYVLPWDQGRKAFPWQRLALDAMQEDAKRELFERAEFKALPQYAETTDDNGGDADA